LAAGRLPPLAASRPAPHTRPLGRPFIREVLGLALLVDCQDRPLVPALHRSGGTPHPPLLLRREHGDARVSRPRGRVRQEAYQVAFLPVAALPEDGVELLVQLLRPAPARGSSTICPTRRRRGRRRGQSGHKRACITLRRRHTGLRVWRQTIAAIAGDEWVLYAGSSG
ncbi:unnamed protein product, partial [Ectocarpus sp. 13 AM-2016]